MKRLGIAAFTVRGGLLADRLSGVFSEEYEILRYEKESSSLKAWCGALFSDGADGILFVSACGIAVRTIASFLRSKTTDPAVVVLDEAGTFAVSLVSGHIGGANRLARLAADAVGAIPVITTATDVNGKFAADVFAKDNDLVIGSMKAAKEVSAAILRGEPVGLYCEGHMKGTPPQELTIVKFPPEKMAGMAGSGHFPSPEFREKDGADSVPRILICISEQNPERIWAAAKRNPEEPQSPGEAQTAAKRNPEGSRTAAKRNEEEPQRPEEPKTAAKRGPGEAQAAAKQSPGEAQTAAKWNPEEPRPAAVRNFREPPDALPADPPCRNRFSFAGDAAPSVLLWLRPKPLTLGIGCRRGKTAEEIRGFVSSVLARFGIDPELLGGAGSIDLKKDEAGLLEFCRISGLPFITWSAEELMEVQGDFTASEFVRSKTGADNVCERAALRLAGSGGKLIVRKQAENGMTAAIARKDWSVRF